MDLLFFLAFPLVLCFCALEFEPPEEEGVGPVLACFRFGLEPAGPDAPVPGEVLPAGDFDPAVVGPVAPVAVAVRLEEPSPPPQDESSSTSAAVTNASFDWRRVNPTRQD